MDAPRWLHFNRVVRDMLLFSLQLADLDTYHYQRRYQLWIYKLVVFPCYLYRHLSERGPEIVWYLVYFFLTQDTSNVRSCKLIDRSTFCTELHIRILILSTVLGGYYSKIETHCPILDDISFRKLG